MTQTEYSTRTLIADEGHKLTQSDESIGLDKRVVSDTVYLASTDSPENWKEITDAEAEALQAEIEAERKLRRDAVATGLQEGMS